MERDLECKSFKLSVTDKTEGTKESVCKWVNQYKKLIDIVSIVFDVDRHEYVVFFYWKKKED